MKRFCWAALLIASLLLAACGNKTATAIVTAAPTATTSSNTSTSTSGTVTASAIVVPETQSQMAFLMSAPIQEVKVKEGDQVKAGQTLIVLNSPTLNFAVVEAQAVLQADQSDAAIQRFRHKEFINGKFVYLSGPPEKIQVADAKVIQSQAALDATQAQLAQGTLVAPYDGTIVSLNVAPGEMVQPGQVVLTIGDLTHLQIETTDLSERDVANVQIGQSANVHIKALNQDFTGKVTAIAPMAVKRNADWVFKVTIQLDSPPPDLLWGMSADVTIQTK